MERRDGCMVVEDALRQSGRQILDHVAGIVRVRPRFAARDENATLLKSHGARQTRQQLQADEVTLDRIPVQEGHLDRQLEYCMGPAHFSDELVLSALELVV